MASQAKVREIFDQFDTDGSGTVSTDELLRLITACNLDMSAEDVAKMIEEVDADGSGEVEFDEFYASLEKQQASGNGGGLLTVTTAAGSLFGWLNPATWFAPVATEEVKPEGSPSQAARHQVALRAYSTLEQKHRPPVAPHSSPMGRDGSPQRFSERKPPSPGTNTPYAAGYRDGFKDASARSQKGTESSRQKDKVYQTVRSKATVLSAWLVLQQNKQQAEEQRQMEIKMRNTLREQQQQFLQRQHRRIERFEQDEIASRISQEKFKATKRAVGVEMRKTLVVQHEEVQMKNRAYVKVMAEKTRDVRRAKRTEIAERHKRAAESAREAGIQAQIERRRHREEALATVRKQEQAAKDFAAQVRFETRPEVRKDTREFFQAQRDAVCAAERLQQERDKMVQEHARQQFLMQTAQTVADVMHTRQTIQQKRLKLVEKSRLEASRVRRQLEEERERNRRNAHSVERTIKEQHDAVIEQRFNPNESGAVEVERILREQGTLGIRSNYKRRSQDWLDSRVDVGFDDLLTS